MEKQFESLSLNNDRRRTAVLTALPNEILSLISNHLEHPKDVLNFSLANRHLHQFVKLDGWNSYLKRRFGLSGRGSDARNAVHGVTTLYRNWERKALVSRYLTPGANTRSLNTWEKVPWRSQHGQTMGYRPSIDSYEEEQGRWADRRETLAWSAGTNVVMRVKETGSKAAKVWESGYDREGFDAYKHLTSWYTYNIPESSEGRDDITSLKLLRPHQKSGESEYIGFGTASGNLSLLEVNVRGEETKRHHYQTGLRAVISLAISQAANPFMLATLGNSSLALYAIDTELTEEIDHQAVGETGGPKVFGEKSGRIWSSNFISENKVAVGLGPTLDPIQILGITPAGFSSEPLRKFSLEYSKSMNTSVYPIIPLPSGSRGGSGDGTTFLSGAYDGIIRLHDMRSPHEFETMFWDVTNDSSVYSLTTQGLEHIVAGTSMHSMLKVFDLRFSGSHAYHSISLAQKTPSQKPNSKTGDYAGNMIVRDAIDHSGATPVTGGWNLFLHPRNQPVHHTQNHSRYDSPIYSLSIPSSTSPSVYAGVEGSVIGIDFHSVTDTHPNPIFSQAIERLPESNTIDIKRSYNSHSDILNLGMYEQGNEQSLDMRLMVQGDVDNELFENKAKRNQALFGGLDERWKDPSDDGERWTRGHQPQGQPPQGRRGRGGRGRGRGRGGARGH